MTGRTPAALTVQRVVFAKDRTGAVEALRVLRATRKTALMPAGDAAASARRVVAAPDGIRDQIRHAGASGRSPRFRRLRHGVYQ